MRIVATLVCALFCAVPASATTIDYLFTYNNLSYRTDLNGVGQTFVAVDPFLADASLLLTTSPAGNPDWWTNGHAELRRGLPGNFDGTSGNVLFRSGVIDFHNLPQVGIAPNGQPLFELRLSNSGLLGPIATAVGDTYSLLLIDNGTSGSVNYASHQPSTYPFGGVVTHNRASSNSFWGGPSTLNDMAFRVVGVVPEPMASTASMIASLMIIRVRRWEQKR